MEVAQAIFKFTLSNPSYSSVGVLLECVSAPRICLVPVGTRRGHWILGKTSLHMVVSRHVGVELNLGPLEELPVLLTTELSPSHISYS